MRELLQTQEILRRVFVDKTHALRGGLGSTQDYFNAVYDENEDAIRINFVGTNVGFLYWLGAFDTVSDLPTDNIKKGSCALVIDDGSGNPAIYWYDGNSWQVLISNSNGQITVKDEGNIVSSTVNTINFIGDGVKVEGSGNEVQVYIPPIDYASHFNTNDGRNDCRVMDVDTYLRHIAKPISEGNSYKIGDWTAGNKYDVVHISNLHYTTNNECSFFDKTTTIEVIIYDADNTTILANHLTNAIVGDIDVTKNNIRIKVSNFSNEGSKYKAKVDVYIDIASILSNGGRFSVKIIHHNGIEGDFIKKQDNIFYDSETYDAQLNGLNIQETNGQIVINYKSGVRAYTLGSKFTVNIADIDYINSNSYPDIVVDVEGSDYGLSMLELDTNVLNNWDVYYDDKDDNYQNTLWEISQLNYFVRTTTAKIHARTKDWINGIWKDSGDNSIIVDTYTDNVGRIYEDFTSETYRLQSDLNSSWNSQESLLVFDGGNGLQVGEGTYLFYPKYNYTIYNPDKNNQYNYSVATGYRYFYRRMWHDNVSHSNGLFNIVGISENDLINNNIKIEISLDGNDWYDCGKDYLGGVLNNGDGCRINSDSKVLPELEFTLGVGKFTDVTTGGGWGIYLRISMPDSSNVMLDKIEIVNWV